MNTSHENYFKFEWLGKYKSTGVPNGYSDAMRIFTKVLKPMLVMLKQTKEKLNWLKPILFLYFPQINQIDFVIKDAIECGWEVQKMENNRLEHFDLYLTVKMNYWQ